VSIPPFVPIRIFGKNPQFHLSSDSRRFTCQGEQAFFIEKAPFSIRTIRLKNHPFFETIRTKLMWGHDVRKNKI
jgi:NAD+ kinase